MKNRAAQCRGNPTQGQPKIPLKMKNKAAQCRSNPTQGQLKNTFEYEEQGCIMQG